jgi:hypothetical protein
VAVVGEPDPADVMAVAAGHVEPAETQSGLDRVQLGQPVLVHRRERVPFAAILRRAAALAPPYFGQPLPGLVAQQVQPVIEPGEMCLLPLDLVDLAGQP